MIQFCEIFTLIVDWFPVPEKFDGWVASHFIFFRQFGLFSSINLSQLYFRLFIG